MPSALAAFSAMVVLVFTPPWVSVSTAPLAPCCALTVTTCGTTSGTDCLVTANSPDRLAKPSMPTFTAPASSRLPLLSKRVASTPFRVSPCTPVTDAVPLMLPDRCPFGPSTRMPAPSVMATRAPSASSAA